MRRSWRDILLLTVFLQLLGFGIVLPLLPYYGRSLGVGGAAIGALFAAYSLTQFLLAPLWGALADRFGRRPVLLASIGWGVAAYLLFALAQTYALLLLSRVLAGLSAAVIGVSQAYLADRTDPDERARGMGLLGAAFGMGFVVGPALGAVLSHWGFDVPGYVAAALAAVNLALAVRWLPESLPPDRRAESVSPRPVWRRGGTPRTGLASVFAILFLTTAAFSILYPVFPLFLQERMGFGPMQAGILFSLMGLVAALVQGGALGRLAAWAGERPLLRAGALLMGLGLGVLPLPFVESQAILVLVLLPMALGFAVTTPVAQALLSRLSSPSEQASNLGVGQSMTSLARACGPLGGGLLFEHLGTPYPFWAAVLLLLGAFALVGAVPEVRGVLPAAQDGLAAERAPAQAASQPGAARPKAPAPSGGVGG
jgi:multidrug resistance protein